MKVTLQDKYLIKMNVFIELKVKKTEELRQKLEVLDFMTTGNLQFVVSVQEEVELILLVEILKNLEKY